MAKRKNAASVPGAGKINGKAKPPTVDPFTGSVLETPTTTFPELELNGVRAMFFPAWGRDGKAIGWNIEIAHPIADALACVDNALAYAIDDNDTVDLWGDLIPTHRRGGNCTLQCGCAAKTIRKFIKQAKRNGFAVVRETKGGAE